MKKLFAFLICALSLMAGVSSSHAGELIPPGSKSYCDSSKPFYFKRRGDQRKELTFDYTHYGFTKDWNRNYNRFKRDRIRGVNIIRPCPGFFSKFNVGANKVEGRFPYNEPPVFAETKIEEYFLPENEEEPVIDEMNDEPEELGDEYVVEDNGVYDMKRHGVPLPREVNYKNGANRGDIIIESENFRLYYILNNRKAIEYHIAVGKDGFTWASTETVTRKKINPDWYPTERMKSENESLPDMVEGGSPENPFGPRAIYLGETQYRIHGTIHPESIGKAASSGCIRMLNADVIELYKKVEIGARVIVYAAPQMPLIAIDRLY